MLAGLGFICGVLLAKLTGVTAPEARIMQMRLLDFDLTNPLLECENADATIGSQIIGPFKDKLSSFVNELQEHNRIHQLSVYFRDLNNGPWHGINQDMEFYPASLLKIPLAMAIMKDAETDEKVLQKKVKAEGHDLNAGVAYRPRDPVRPGISYTVAELVEKSLAASDNNAAALLGRIAKKQTLKNTFTDLGIRYPTAMPVDYLSVRDFSTFFRILFNASYISKESSERLLEIMSRSEFKDGIVAGVPTGIAVSHKHGEQTLGQRGEIKELHDCGIVYYPNNPYLLCIMSKGETYEEDAAAIRDISRFVFQIVDAHERRRPGMNIQPRLQ